MIDDDSRFTWAVIGAGPAGIAAIGRLLDQQIPAEQIAWIDPNFDTGDFGTKWRKVSSNTSVKLFKRFYRECDSFDYAAFANECIIDTLDPKDTCLLEHAALPLQKITDHLGKQVVAIKNKAQHLELKNHHWSIKLSQSDNSPNITIQAKNVILAIGSEPKSLHFPGMTEIPLVKALDPEELNDQCTSNDVVAVFGSSHSAIIIIRLLLEYTRAKQIINFYQNPLRYAVDLGDWILFDDTGLKGETAKWARTHLHGEMPERLTRMISNEDAIKEFLPQCSKAIYPVGFTRRHITISGMPVLKYNEHNGIIAPGLFGVGIAFPEAATDRYGNLEYRVGLWKFMDYLNRVLPLWLKYPV